MSSETFAVRGVQPGGRLHHGEGRIASGFRTAPPRHTLGSGLKRAAGFVWWVVTGFGLLHALTSRGRRSKREEIVVYSVHRAFFVWPLILAGFVGAAVVRSYPDAAGFWGWAYVGVLLYTLVTLLFDVGTAKAVVCALVFGFVWLASKYVEDFKHVTLLSGVFAHLRDLRPTLNPGFALIVSWLLLGPWVGALLHSFGRGRTTFSPNGIEEWFLGDGREITDRSGLKFRSRYRDLFETPLGFGCGDLEAVDGNGRVVKRWENVMFLFFLWNRLDEILHQRAAVVDNAPDDPVEVEEVHRVSNAE